MKVIILLFLLFLNPIQTFSQVFIEEIKVEWESLEISHSDSIKNKLLGMHPDLIKANKDISEIQKGFTHVVNLNNDSLPDVIIYWTDFYNENLLEIYTNKGDSLSLRLREHGQITRIEKGLPTSPLQISMNEVKYSSQPFLAEYKEITFFADPDEIKVTKVDYYEDTEFPDDLKFHTLFEVSQPKYRLRKSPKIDNKNVIQELTQGDRGIALAEKEDETGRTWWFVKVFNNIDKSSSDFYYINLEEPNRISNQCFGWISSRFVKKIEE